MRLMVLYQERANALKNRKSEVAAPDRDTFTSSHAGLTTVYLSTSVL